MGLSTQHGQKAEFVVG